MKRLYESKLRKSIAMIVITFICIIMETIIVHASEEVKVNTLYEITQDTNVYEQADENSTVISQLSQGTPVFCIEASNNGWTKIMYQDIEGYIPVSAIQQYGDVEEISEEFVEAGEENELRFERMEQYMEQRKSESIWGTVIVLLIVSIFIVGIVSTVKKNKANKKAEN